MFDRLSDVGKPISRQSQFIHSSCNTQVLVIVMTFLNNQFSKGTVFWQQHWVFNLRWAFYFLVYSGPWLNYPTLITKFWTSSRGCLSLEFSKNSISCRKCCLWAHFINLTFATCPVSETNKPDNQSNNSQNFREFWKFFEINNTFIFFICSATMHLCLHNTFISGRQTF